MTDSNSLIYEMKKEIKGTNGRYVISSNGRVYTTYGNKIPLKVYKRGLDETRSHYVILTIDGVTRPTNLWKIIATNFFNIDPEEVISIVFKDGNSDNLSLNNIIIHSKCRDYIKELTLRNAFEEFNRDEEELIDKIYLESLGIPREILRCNVYKKNLKEELDYICKVFVLCDSGKLSSKKIAELTGLSQDQINKIIRGDRWRSRRFVYEKFRILTKTR